MQRLASQRLIDDNTRTYYNIKKIWCIEVGAMADALAALPYIHIKRLQQARSAICKDPPLQAYDAWSGGCADNMHMHPGVAVFPRLFSKKPIKRIPGHANVIYAFSNNKLEGNMPMNPG